MERPSKTPTFRREICNFRTRICKKRVLHILLMKSLGLRSDCIPTVLRRSLPPADVQKLWVLLHFLRVTSKPVYGGLCSPPWGGPVRSSSSWFFRVHQTAFARELPAGFFYPSRLHNLSLSSNSKFLHPVITARLTISLSLLVDRRPCVIQ